MPRIAVAAQVQSRVHTRRLGGVPLNCPTYIIYYKTHARIHTQRRRRRRRRGGEGVAEPKRRQVLCSVRAASVCAQSMWCTSMTFQILVCARARRVRVRTGK